MDFGSGLFAFLGDHGEYHPWLSSSFPSQSHCDNWMLFQWPRCVFLGNNTILSSEWVLTSVWFVGWALRALLLLLLFASSYLVLRKMLFYILRKTSSCQALFYEIFGSFFFLILANLVLEKPVRVRWCLLKRYFRSSQTKDHWKLRIMGSITKFFIRVYFECVQGFTLDLLIKKDFTLDSVRLLVWYCAEWCALAPKWEPQGQNTSTSVSYPRASIVTN